MMAEKTREDKNMKAKERQNKCEKTAEDQRHLSPSLFVPHQTILYQDPTHSPPRPFSTYLPSPLLLLTPSLVRLLIRAGGTIVPLLPLFGNPGLKQTLFTQAVAQPGPSPSLQLGQVWLSLFSKCYNKPLSQPPKLICSPLSFHSPSIPLLNTSFSIFPPQSKCYSGFLPLCTP